MVVFLLKESPLLLISPRTHVNSVEDTDSITEVKVETGLEEVQHSVRVEVRIQALVAELKTTHVFNLPEHPGCSDDYG